MKFGNVFTLKTGTLEELNSIVTQPGFKGTIADLPAHLYHKCAGISRSTLSELEQSYAHYEEKRKNPKKATKDMIFGSAFHDYAMLPKEFERNFAVEPVKTPDMLDTAEHLKAHLNKFIDTSKLKEELAGLEHSLSTHEESCLMPHPSEEELAVLDVTISEVEKSLLALVESDFPSKKEFQASQKESKDLIKAHKVTQKDLNSKIKEYQSVCKNKANDIKVEIKNVKDKIQSLESKLTGTKAKLSANIREFDKEVQIWEEIYTEFEKTCVGKESITSEEFSRIKIMAANAKNHPTLKLLSSHEVIYEQTFFWRDEDTGLLCKARPDIIYITPNMLLVGDYKTTDDASPREFQRTLGNFEYHIQSAFYLDGINIVLGLRLENFLFIPVEKQAPHQLALYAIDKPAQETGRVKYKGHLKTLASYEPGGANENGWKGYPTEIQNISIPVYMMMEA